MTKNGSEVVPRFLYVILGVLLVSVVGLVFVNSTGFRRTGSFFGSAKRSGVNEQSNQIAPPKTYTNIFGMSGWDNGGVITMDKGKGATFLNYFTKNFMYVIGNQNPDSYLYIEDNSEISFKFTIGKELLRTEKLGNYRFGLRFFGSPVKEGGPKMTEYMELAFFKDFYSKAGRVGYVVSRPGIESKADMLRIKIPFEKEDFEIQVRPQNDGKTEIVVRDSKLGAVIGTEMVNFILFPRNYFLNTKVELGNQIAKIDVTNFEIYCSKCVKK